GGSALVHSSAACIELETNDTVRPSFVLVVQFSKGKPLERASCRSSPQPFHIFRMKESGPKVRSHNRFHGEAAEIEHRLVRVKCGSIRSQHHHRLCNRVGNLSKLPFVLPEFFFSPPALFDVSTRSIPVHDVPLLVAQGFG